MAQLKDSLITGDLRVTGTIYGKVTNAVLADEATAVRDKGNGTLTYLNYSASGMSTTSWVGSWDGYTLKAISPANLKTTMSLNNVENTKLSTWAGSSNITTIGTLSSGTVPWARLSNVPSSFTPSSHSHGNITNAGAIGSTANYAVYTGANGVLTAASLAVSDPAASGSGITYISSISQDSKGQISATKSTVRDASASQSGIVSTGTQTLAGDKWLSGTTTIEPASIFRNTVGQVIAANANAVIQSPIPKYLWHDVLAFNRATTPKYYTTSNGTTWTEATLDKRLFIHKEAWGKINILDSSISGSRWTWIGGGLAYCSATWLVIGVAYASPIAKFDVLLETSSGSDDSATWTTLVNATGISVNQTPIWIKTNTTSTNNIRLTITRNSASENTTTLPITSIRWLTTRWGDQGKGSEFEYPYQWNENNTIFPITNNTSDLGGTSYKWKTVYATTFDGTATNANQLAYTHTNEINFNGTEQARVWFNYRVGSTDAVKGSNVTVNYKFGNFNGGTTGVTLDADYFSGAATSANAVNLYETRATTTTLNKTANYVGAGKMFHLVASSSTSATDNGKPPLGDANVFQMNWDNNGGYDAQLAISTASSRMEFRDRASKGTAWREVVTSTPESATGGATTPVYISTTGVATTVTLTGATSLRNSLGLGTGNGALAVVNGGTGATTAADARTNLGAAAANHTHPIKTITGTIPTSTSSPWTINATNKTVQISDSKITAKSVLQWGLASTATQAQYEAFAEAQFIDSTTAAGSATIKALGTMPTVAIPVVIHILGETE